MPADTFEIPCRVPKLPCVRVNRISHMPLHGNAGHWDMRSEWLFVTTTGSI